MKSLVIKIVVIILIVFVGSAFLAINQNWVKPGEFGDMFGAVNALFSGAALIGIAYTILLQQEEIKEGKIKRKKQIEPILNIVGKRSRESDVYHTQVTISDPG